VEFFSRLQFENFVGEDGANERMLGLMQFRGNIVKNNFPLVQYCGAVGNIENIVNNMGDDDGSEVVVLTQRADQ